MVTTIVGIFDEYANAQTAVSALSKAGVKQGDVSIARNHPAGENYTTYGGANSKDYTTGKSIGTSISDFFAGIFGTDEDASTKQESEIYAESVRRGSTVVAVRAEDNLIDQVADILNQNGAADVDRRASQYRAAGYKNYDAKAPLYNAEQSKTEFGQFASQGEVALPVIEEQLNIGKRVVQRGSVRVHTTVTSRPVEENITLREENVRVERHAVNRVATDADLANFKDGEMTLTQSSEVPVVSKTARIVEEVVVGKETTERSETVRDTVRKTDVEIEDSNAKTTNRKQ